MRAWAASAAGAVLFIACGCAGHGHHHGAKIDPEIAQTIDSIWAVDNHAHPVLAPPQDATDREFDALPVDSMEPESDPPAYRPDFPQLQDAWKALWGFDERPPLDASGLRRLNAARSRVKTREGE